MRPWLPLIALSLALLALLPLRIVLGGSGLAARAVSGSIWMGQLRQAEWRGLALGDLALRLQPTALLRGRLRYAVAGARLNGFIWQGRDSGVSDLTGQIPLAGVTSLPVVSMDLAGAGVDWRADGCRSAAGEVRLLLAGLLAGLGPLSGQPRCEAGRLVLPLASADGHATLTIRIDATGWTGRLTAGGVDPSTATALLAAGFAPGPTGPVLDSGGRW